MKRNGTTVGQHGWRAGRSMMLSAGLFSETSDAGIDEITLKRSNMSRRWVHLFVCDFCGDCVDRLSKEWSCCWDCHSNEILACPRKQCQDRLMAFADEKKSKVCRCPTLV